MISHSTILPSFLLPSFSLCASLVFVLLSLRSFSYYGFVFRFSFLASFPRAARNFDPRQQHSQFPSASRHRSKRHRVSGDTQVDLNRSLVLMKSVTLGSLLHKGPNQWSFKSGLKFQAQRIEKNKKYITLRKTVCGSGPNPSQLTSRFMVSVVYKP